MSAEKARFNFNFSPVCPSKSDSDSAVEYPSRPHDFVHRGDTKSFSPQRPIFERLPKQTELNIGDFRIAMDRLFDGRFRKYRICP
jgi:hypothetical protein